ncbi:MAG: hypothetical protein FWG13_06530 [Leptospirales bacterium]|nr:hypothetical protein [Leptospirales bacterium]
MRDSIDINNLLLCAVFSALGITVPVIFHILAMGSAFLPMFIPLAIGAFFLDIKNALIIAIATPLASALLTGMPPLYPPIAFIMAAELAVFCFIISLLNAKTKLPVLAVLLIAETAERTLQVLLYLYIMPLFGISAAAWSVYDILKVMPGIILMSILVPIIVPAARKIIERRSLRLFEYRNDDELENIR